MMVLLLIFVLKIITVLHLILKQIHFLSIQHIAKLLEQLKSGFKRTINWNKYEPKLTVEQRNQYLDFLINRSFQGVNRLFV